MKRTFRRALFVAAVVAGAAEPAPAAEPAGVDLLTPPPVPPTWADPPKKPMPQRKKELAAPPVVQTRAATATSAPAKAPAAQVRPASHSARPQPSGPRVTTGTIILDDEPGTPPPPPARPEPVAPARLQQRVRAACGNLARDVTVSPQPDRTVRVRVKAAPGVPETTLAERILWLPEMALPQVHLEIEKAP